MRVLAIGPNAESFCREVFPDAVIDTTPLKPGKKQTGYDSVVSYMVLQTVSHGEMMKIIRSQVAALKPGGEMTILVPSLEWAAVQVLSKDRSPKLQVHLFGPQNSDRDTYRSGFTMMDLRAVMAESGLAVTHASTGIYMIDSYEAELHTARGVRKKVNHEPKKDL